MPKEFEEIGNCGGKLEVLFDKENKRISSRFSHNSPTPAALFQVGISLDGTRQQYWPIYGIRETEPPPMVPAFVVSDIEGLFGRKCPTCKSYFRTTCTSQIIICPYCGYRGANTDFTTHTQSLFLNKIRESYLEAIKKETDVIIDLGEIAKGLPENKPEWAYSEERQQNRYQCPECKTRYDILGEYAGCPYCGKRNSLQVVQSKFDALEKDFRKADQELTDRHDREIEWEKMTRCVSDFEAMARDVQSQLIIFPATPKRKKEIEQLSVQQIQKARDCLNQWFNFDIFDKIGNDDQTFLVRMFYRRHIFIHNAGRVDQEYLDRSKDTSVRLNQKIAVRSKEIFRLLSLLRSVSTNLFAGYESIS